MVSRVDSPADLGIPSFLIKWLKLGKPPRPRSYNEATPGLAISDQLRGFQEIVVARRIQRKSVDALRMD